jgi:hypothetical protein
MNMSRIPNPDPFAVSTSFNNKAEQSRSISFLAYTATICLLLPLHPYEGKSTAY